MDRIQQVSVRSPLPAEKPLPPDALDIVDIGLIALWRYIRLSGRLWTLQKD